MATRSNRRQGAVKPRPGVKPRPAGAEVEAEVVDEREADEQAAAAVPEAPPAQELVTTQEAIVDGATGEVLSEGDPDPETPAAGDPDPAIADADGDGIPDHLDLDETEYRKYWLQRLADSKITPPKGHILFPGEPLTFSGNVVQGDMVQLTEDIYRMVIPFRSRRPTFTLEAKAGTIVPKVRVVTKTQYRKAVGGLFDAILEG